MRFLIPTSISVMIFSFLKQLQRNFKYLNSRNASKRNSEIRDDSTVITEIKIGSNCPDNLVIDKKEKYINFR